MECDKSTTNTKLVEEPKAGMFFDSYEQVLQYYESYAKQEGFAVFSRTSTKGEGNKIYKTLSCCVVEKVREFLNQKMSFV